MVGERKRKRKPPMRVGVAISDQVGTEKYQESHRKSYFIGRWFYSLGQRMVMYFCVYKTCRPRQWAVYLWLSLTFIIIHKVVLDAQLLKELAFSAVFLPLRVHIESSVLYINQSFHDSLWMVFEMCLGVWWMNYAQSVLHYLLLKSLSIWDIGWN